MKARSGGGEGGAIERGVRKEGGDREWRGKGRGWCKGGGRGRTVGPSDGQGDTINDEKRGI